MIESNQNLTYRKLLSLTSSKGLKEEGVFLLSGEKLTKEFLLKPNLPLKAEIRIESQISLAPDVDQIILANELFKQIDVLGTGFNILVIEQPHIVTLTGVEIQNYEPHGIELVAPVGDPSNLGALIRSCEAFGIKRVILAREASHPFLPKAIRASAGSVLRVQIVRGPALADFPASCIALDLEGTPIDDFIWPKDALLLVGEEGPGIRDARFERRLYIPTFGVESLNVVVAASIALSRIPHINAK